MGLRGPKFFECVDVSARGIYLDPGNNDVTDTDTGGSCSPVKRIERWGYFDPLTECAPCRVVAGRGEGDWSWDTKITFELWVMLNRGQWPEIGHM